MGKFKPARRFNPGSKKPSSQPDSRSKDEQKPFKAAQEDILDAEVNKVDINRARQVPMEFRAQVPGRCQRQKADLNDAKDWIDEWVKNVDLESPFSTKGLHIVEAQIDWRLISNSGVDEGIIRPVIGAGGWPLIPGSGIKGLFRRACPTDKVQLWCGSGDLRPGLLRFHGAWPADEHWRKGLLDVAHPQQNWQLGFLNGREKHNANAVVSLYRPLLIVGLSSSHSIAEKEWEEIKSVLRSALARGLGGRTASGYGRSAGSRGKVLFECALTGQGTASKLLDGGKEFRHNIFRASVRSMTMRLFAGICDEESTNFVVNRLFGNISTDDKPQIGLLATAFETEALDFGIYGKHNQDTFTATGVLKWLQAREPGPDENLSIAAELLEAIHGLVMVLGGFGKGWRRPDHSLFPLKYGESYYNRFAIGCHWQWYRPDDISQFIHVNSADQIANLLRKSRSLARKWLTSMRREYGHQPPAWREVLSPEKACIWVRPANDYCDAEVVNWLHEERHPSGIKGSEVTGRINSVGRLWNRMYALNTGAPLNNDSAIASNFQPSRNVDPFARAVKPGSKQGQAKHVATQTPREQVYIKDFWKGNYLEVVTFFPHFTDFPDLNPSAKCKEFLSFMKTQEGRVANFSAIDFTDS